VQQKLPAGFQSLAVTDSDEEGPQCDITIKSLLCHFVCIHHECEA